LPCPGKGQHHRLAWVQRLTNNLGRDRNIACRRIGRDDGSQPGNRPGCDLSPASRYTASGTTTSRPSTASTSRRSILPRRIRDQCYSVSFVLLWTSQGRQSAQSGREIGASRRCKPRRIAGSVTIGPRPPPFCPAGGDPGELGASLG
jgi:hypothetical protein